MRSGAESKHTCEVTAILVSCRAEVAYYCFNSEVEAVVALALVSEVFADLPLEPELLDLFEPLGQSLMM
jgi:hypothetical protein